MIFERGVKTIPMPVFGLKWRNRWKCFLECSLITLNAPETEGGPAPHTPEPAADSTFNIYLWPFILTGKVRLRLDRPIVLLNIFHALCLDPVTAGSLGSLQCDNICESLCKYYIPRTADISFYNWKLNTNNTEDILSKPGRLLNVSKLHYQPIYQGIENESSAVGKETQ